ncbi:glucocorticoid modulatory element-binding protein 1-like [Anguilla rostrata]|uniref:glucocorticoid modulatory element-binding protein 1-like n=1 Tax=Anguilla rostrata TaxID=7938 RepID=UPI0030CACCC9
MAVSVADVVMVKTEDDDSNDSAKTQVILQLHPITQGVCEVTGEMGTAVVAVETHNEDSDVEGAGIEYGYPITCGGSAAVLLFKKFVCPGINVRCVKYNGQIISPKQFVHLAGKATLKDWKRAIRLGGVMLRKMMDSGQIDFYQHDTVCTNTCRSTKFDLLISNTRFPPPGSALPAPPSPQGNGGPVAIAEDQPEETVATAAEWTSSVATAIATATKAEIKREMGEISEDTLSFWKGIADVGLMAEVVSNIRSELLALLRDIQLRSGQGALQEPDAAALNTLAQMFGLLDSVKRALESRRARTDQNQEHRLHRTLNSMERQLEEQKKPCDWQQHPQALPSMLHMSPPPAPKQPRLQRPASSSTLIGSSPAMIGSSHFLAQRSSGPAPITCTLPQIPIGSQLRTSCYDPAPSKEHSGAGPPEDQGVAGGVEDEEHQAHTTAIKIDPTAGQIYPTAGEINPTAGEVNPTAGQIYPTAGGGGRGVEEEGQGVEEEEEEEDGGMQL